MQKIIKYVATNDRGYRIGESHHNAKLNQAIADRIREMHEDEGIGYRRISKALDISISMVRKVCAYQLWAQTPERWKRIEVFEEVEVIK